MLTAALIALLQQVIVPAAGTVALGLISAAFMKLRKKWNVEALSTVQGVVERAAIQGIALAEEKAADALKKQTGPLTGNEKLDTAIAHVLGAIPSLTRDEAQRAVESGLAQVPGVGATGDQCLSPCSVQ